MGSRGSRVAIATLVTVLLSYGIGYVHGAPVGTGSEAADMGAPSLTAFTVSPTTLSAKSTVTVTLSIGYKDAGGDLRGGYLLVTPKDCKGVGKKIQILLDKPKHSQPEGTDKIKLTITTRDCTWLNFVAQLKDSTGKVGPAKLFKVALLPPWGTKLGERALNFTLKDQDGRAVSLHDYMGQVIMLDLSAMWCSPCQGEASDAQFLYTTYKDRGFVVLTALIENYNGDAVTTDDAKSWAQTYGLTFPVLADEQEKVWNLYDETDYVPLNLVIDKKMVIRYKDTGYDGDVRREIEAHIQSLLNQ